MFGAKFSWNESNVGWKMCSPSVEWEKENVSSGGIYRGMHEPFLHGLINFYKELTCMTHGILPKVNVHC